MSVFSFLFSILGLPGVLLGFVWFVVLCCVVLWFGGAALGTAWLVSGRVCFVPYVM